MQLNSFALEAEEFEEIEREYQGDKYTQRFQNFAVFTPFQKYPLRWRKRVQSPADECPEGSVYQLPLDKLEIDQKGNLRFDFTRADLIEYPNFKHQFVGRSMPKPQPKVAS